MMSILTLLPYQRAGHHHNTIAVGAIVIRVADYRKGPSAFPSFPPTLSQ